MKVVRKAKQSELEQNQDFTPLNPDEPEDDLTVLLAGKTLRIYADGGARNNPGPAALAFIFVDEDHNVVHRRAEYLGVKTNNQAELLAIHRALVTARAYTSGKIEVYSDSLNAISWLNGTYRIKSSNVAPLVGKIRAFVRDAQFEQVSFIHRRRGDHFIEICDAMVTECQEGNLAGVA